MVYAGELCPRKSLSQSCIPGSFGLRSGFHSLSRHHSTGSPRNVPAQTLNLYNKVIQRPQFCYISNAMNISELSISELKRLVRIKEQIAQLESELARLTNSAAKEKPAKRKGKISAAGRARIVAAQKARWARVKAAKKK